MLRAGDVAPSFALPADDGATVQLSDFVGKKVVLYFYPKDDTPGCTTESCEFRDNLSILKSKGAIVLGVSILDAKSKAKFKEKYSLNFPLLADEDHAVSEQYGVWGLKKAMGREYMGIYRTTFIIDGTGRIARVFEGVKAEGHALQVLEAL